MKAKGNQKFGFQPIYKKASKKLLELSRNYLEISSQMVTAHNRLNKHESIINPRLCSEEEETSWHIVGDSHLA